MSTRRPRRPRREDRDRPAAPGEPLDPGLQPRTVKSFTKGGSIQLGTPGSLAQRPKGLTYGGPLVATAGLSVPPLVPSVENGAERFVVGPPLPDLGLPAITLAPLPRPGVLAPDNPLPLPYKPVEATLPAGFALLDVYLPAGQPPAGGWPVLLTTRVAGWFGAPVRGSLDPSHGFDALLHKAVNAGLAVLDVGSNSSGVTGNPVQPAWFSPPGLSGGSWEDESQTLPDKDLVHAVQWTKDQALFPLDPERIILLGFSAGAQIALWLAFHPDLASSTGSSQVRRDTSVAGIVAFDPISSFVAQRDDWQVANARFESLSRPGQDALDLADVDPLVRDLSSPLRALVADTSRAPRVPCFLACDESLAVPDFSLEPDDHPSLRNALGAPDVHDLWNAAMTSVLLNLHDADFHGSRTELHVHATALPSLASVQALVSGTFQGELVTGQGVGTFWDTVVQWLVARASEPRPTVAGLQLHPRRGVIHGRPNLAQPPSAHIIAAANAFGTTSTQLTVEVRD